MGMHRGRCQVLVEDEILRFAKRPRAAEGRHLANLFAGEGKEEIAIAPGRQRLEGGKVSE
jgi:hypothetical protein